MGGLSCRALAHFISYSHAKQEKLETRARKYTSPYLDVIRPKIVLLAAQGLSNDVIAIRLDTPRQIVSKWRKRLWQGVPLSPTDFVISADEKTSVQARRRKQPTLSCGFRPPHARRA